PPPPPRQDCISCGHWHEEEPQDGCSCCDRSYDDPDAPCAPLIRPPVEPELTEVTPELILEVVRVHTEDRGRRRALRGERAARRPRHLHRDGEGRAAHRVRLGLPALAAALPAGGRPRRRRRARCGEHAGSRRTGGPIALPPGAHSQLTATSYPSASFEALAAGGRLQTNLLAGPKP